MLKASVVTAFDGVPDGKIHSRRFLPGDEVHGDLARVAVEQKWALEVVAEPAPSAPPSQDPAPIPETWQELNAADSIALARSLGADDAVRTKAAAVEFVTAEVERRKAAEGTQV